jgi:hypothetical protein
LPVPVNWFRASNEFYSSSPRRGQRGFLDEPSQHFAVPQRPIDVLKTGNVEKVIAAACASGESFT